MKAAARDTRRAWPPLTAALLLASAAVRAQPIAPSPVSGLSLRGSGPFTLPAADVLDRDRVLAGLAVDNRDRDPLGLDLLDGSVVFAAGLGAGLEAYGTRRSAGWPPCRSEHQLGFVLAAAWAF